MPGPYDYSINVPDPSQAFVGGLQQGIGLQNLAIQQQQQQLGLAQQQLQMRALSSLASNPNAGSDDYARVMTLVPSIAEPLQKAWAVKNTEQQQQQLTRVAQWSAAIQQGHPDVAASLIRQHADALDAAAGGQPTQEAQFLRAKAQAIDQGQGTADLVNSILLKPLLMAHPDGKKYVDNIVAMGQEARAQALQPATLLKTGSEAATAAANAAYAPQTAAAAASTAQSGAVLKGIEAGNAPTATVLGNEKTAQEIAASKLTGDIARLTAQISAANSETERGKLTLERDKMLFEQQRLLQAQGQQAQDAQNQATTALQTLDQIKQHPGMQSNLLQMIPGMPGSKPGALWGEVFEHLPGTDRNALSGWVDSLKGQLGYANLMAAKAASPNGASGFGQLSEKELSMLSNLAGNLNLNSADFPLQLGRVEQFLRKTQATAVARPQLPNTGEAFVMRHPVYGNVTEGQINNLMRQFPGSTRDQVLKFLQDSGGK